jgi:FMN reductase
MSDIVTIAGCPSLTSASTAVLNYAHTFLAHAGVRTKAINVRQLPSDDLLLGRTYSAPIRHSINLLKQADGVIIATSVCKAAYSGGLKAFLDILPQDAFKGKVVLPIAISASPGQFTEVDHSLRAVLGVLGATHMLEGVYLLDSQVQLYDRQIWFDQPARQRLHWTLQRLIGELAQKSIPSLFGPIPVLPALAVAN